MNENRGSWYLLTGVLIGLAIGVVYAWLFRPVQYVNTSPASLQIEDKDKYRALIALAYEADGDLVRAKARLALLKDADVFTSLSEQAQRWLAEGSAPEEARALGLLSVALGQSAGPAGGTAARNLTPAANEPTQAMQTLMVELGMLPSATITETLEAPETSLPASETLPAAASPSTTSEPLTTAEQLTESPQVEFSPSPQASPRPSSTPRPSPTQAPTFTPLPTRTATATPGAPFVLKDRAKVCSQSLPEPLLQVEALDAAGQPVPGVEVIVNWDGGEEHFYTGLKPEVDLGYADFTMQESVVYNLRLAEGGQPVTGLTAAECEQPGSGRTWGAWLLTFEQP
jgi:hypothetical protein